jgi:hypothetical protein
MALPAAIVVLAFAGSVHRRTWVACWAYSVAFLENPVPISYISDHKNLGLPISFFCIERK